MNNQNNNAQLQIYQNNEQKDVAQFVV